MQNLTSFGNISIGVRPPPPPKKKKKINEQVKYDLKCKLLDTNFLDKNGKITYSYSVQQHPGSCNIALLT